MRASRWSAIALYDDVALPNSSRRLRVAPEALSAFQPGKNGEALRLVEGSS